MATRKLYPECNPTINYHLANATYCDLGNMEVTEEIVDELKKEMTNIYKNEIR
jgi:hypothetical protein